MKPSEEEYTRRIEEIIREQEAAESSVAVKQLVTAPKHTEQDLRMKLSEDEYNRRIEDLTNMQETVEMDTLVNSSGEMPIQNPIEEHRPYGMSERTSSSAIFQLPENSPYAYFNSAFLYIFLRTPSPFITAESIRIRFGGQFLSFLSSEQIVRALIVLLDNKLELPKEDQKEFIETIFGHIDYSLELVITKAQVVMLVDAMMRSNVPDYFEQVFLTWKMWYNFTVNEQEVMLKKAKMKYKREVLVMLYLFVMNRDGTNSQRCEIFKNNIKNQYKETGIFKYGYSLENLVRKGNEWMIGVFSIILDTFDTCLLDLPEVFKGLENNAISTFWNFFRNYFYTRDQKDVLHILKYKSHVCYALTKFTPEFEQINNSGEINGIKRNSRLYFDPANVKLEFANWIRILKNNNRFGGTISTYGLEREFVNAFAMLRQISQCDEYNCNTLLTIFNNVNFTEHFDEPYFILLLSLTNENIFSDLIETQEWSEYVKARSKLTTEYRFIEEIFMNNACFDPSLHLKHHTKPCVIKIHEILFKLNMKGGIRMHREHYFYQRLLFHLRLDIFNGADLLGYIQGLDTIGCLSTKEQSVQIARDLVFSEYYCEAAMELKDKITMFKWWTKLGDGIRWIGKEWELYKNKEDIKREREFFRRC
ncbi:hypothetical protein PAEPH01_1955 [Pancytospora epiphaga]|nr:hypothetical protein PAEPH01_1955 [Pancytospora epiphaga]